LTTTDTAQSTDVNGEKSKNAHKSFNSKNLKKPQKRFFQLQRSENGNNLSPMAHSFDLWLSTKNMKRIPHQTLQHGNCLYESVANCIQLWKEKTVKLRLHMINWHVCK